MFSVWRCSNCNAAWYACSGNDAHSTSPDDNSCALQSDATKAKLTDRHLTSEDYIQTITKWQAQRNAIALEQAGMWLHQPESCQHCHDAMGEDTTAASSSSSSSALPPAHGFVDVCGIELPCREDATSTASTSAHQVCWQEPFCGPAAKAVSPGNLPLFTHCDGGSSPPLPPSIHVVVIQQFVICPSWLTSHLPAIS